MGTAKSYVESTNSLESQGSDARQACAHGQPPTGHVSRPEGAGVTQGLAMENIMGGWQLTLGVCLN